MLTDAILLVTFCIGVGIILFLRSFDFYEPEPYAPLFASTALGGMTAVGLSLSIYSLLHSLGVGELKNISGALFVIAPVEELSKLLGFFVCYPMIRKHLNEPVDGILYIACVALGFSLVENILYIASSTALLEVAFTRIFISTPVHISFSALMGLAIFCITRYQMRWRILLFGMVYACLSHALFDVLLFEEVNIIIVLAFTLFSYYVVLTWLGYTVAISPFKKTLSQYIEEYDAPETMPGLECLYCGDTEPKQSYSVGGISIQQCAGCGRFVSTSRALFKLFYRFGARFNTLMHRYREHDGEFSGLETFYDGNYFSGKRGLAFFNLNELNRSLERSRHDVIRRIQRLFGFLFVPGTQGKIDLHQ